LRAAATGACNDPPGASRSTDIQTPVGDRTGPCTPSQPPAISSIVARPSSSTMRGTSSACSAIAIATPCTASVPLA
jgi:hypothetical protein